MLLTEEDVNSSEKIGKDSTSEEEKKEQKETIENG